MVNVDDLMRGDYIYYIGPDGNKEICVVDSITSKAISCKSEHGWTSLIEPERFEYIPLTDEILVNSGFVKHGSEETDDVFYSYHQVALENSFGGFMWGYIYDMMLDIDDSLAMCPMGKADYVHELQHVLKTCACNDIILKIA